MRSLDAELHPPGTQMPPRADALRRKRQNPHLGPTSAPAPARFGPCGGPYIRIVRLAIVSLRARWSALPFLVLLSFFFTSAEWVCIRFPLRDSDLGIEISVVTKRLSPTACRFCSSDLRNKKGEIAACVECQEFFDRRDAADEVLQPDVR